MGQQMSHYHCINTSVFMMNILQTFIFCLSIRVLVAHCVVDTSLAQWPYDSCSLYFCSYIAETNGRIHICIWKAWDKPICLTWTICILPLSGFYYSLHWPFEYSDVILLECNGTMMWWKGNSYLYRWPFNNLTIKKKKLKTSHWIWNLLFSFNKLI